MATRSSVVEKEKKQLTATTFLKNYPQSKHAEQYATLTAAPSASGSKKNGTLASADFKVVPDPEFIHERGVLAMKPFADSHTGNNITKELNAIAERWNIPQSKIHLLVHDSGANMIKGVLVVEYDSAKCSIHSLSTDDDSSPPSKKRNINEDDRTIEIHDSFWNCFEDIAAGAGNMQNEVMETSAIAHKIDFYLKTVCLDQTADPYKLWSENAKQYPIHSS
ncbi:hypothetical protein ILUMI_00529 [Ignelater luminosus]|uniref:Uncharacterized protein n=1 Tax=Ignelater luminosus TaxID=2038154 RepID=A0A8K0DK20_IGNLU|nr:hypothetical protein ILUMI_00529 [Ignelater luminosus]